MPDTFGAELRRLRIAAGLTGKTLAVAAGLSPQYLNDLEHGRRIPTAQVVTVVAPIITACLPDGVERRWGYLHLRKLAFVARGEVCPRCGFGGED